MPIALKEEPAVKVAPSAACYSEVLLWCPPTQTARAFRMPRFSSCVLPKLRCLTCRRCALSRILQFGGTCCFSLCLYHSQAHSSDAVASLWSGLAILTKLHLVPERWLLCLLRRCCLHRWTMYYTMRAGLSQWRKTPSSSLYHVGATPDSMHTTGQQKLVT